MVRKMTWGLVKVRRKRVVDTEPESGRKEEAGGPCGSPLAWLGAWPGREGLYMQSYSVHSSTVREEFLIPWERWVNWGSERLAHLFLLVPQSDDDFEPSVIGLQNALSHWCNFLIIVKITYLLCASVSPLWIKSWPSIRRKLQECTYHASYGHQRDARNGTVQG